MADDSECPPAKKRMSSRSESRVSAAKDPATECADESAVDQTQSVPADVSISKRRSRRSTTATIEVPPPRASEDAPREEIEEEGEEEEQNPAPAEEVETSHTEERPTSSAPAPVQDTVVPAAPQKGRLSVAEQRNQLQSIEGARLTSQKTVEEVFANCERDEDGGIRIGDIYLPPPPPPACTFDATGPRLVISKIENSWFKSYGKNVIIGPLHKNYSSIVGPNGSGKSNVIDSMLFVFGYRSKKVRAQKVGNLIHSCDAHKNIQSCTVNVHFEVIVDKGDNFEVVPNSQLVIGRTANRDNSSYYMINGFQVSQKVVTKKLREKGIDIDHDRFLILQGEVEQISMMKPKGEHDNDEGMLEYLEDIIGTNRYKEPIEKFVRNVDSLQEERNRALDRLQMAEQDMLAAKQLRNEAIEYLTLCNDIIKCDHKLFSISRLQEVEKRVKIEENVTKQKAELENVHAKMEEFITQNKELTDSHKKLSRQEAEAVKKSEDLQAQYSKLETKDLKIIEEIKHAKTLLKKLEKDRDNQLKNIEKLKSNTEKLPAQQAEAEKAEEKLAKEIAEVEATLQEKMEALNKKVGPIQEEKESLEQNLLKLQASVNAAKSAFTMAQSSLDLLTSSEKSERKKLEEHESHMAEAQKLLQEKQEEAGRIQEALPKRQQDYEALRSELSVVAKEYEECRHSCRSETAKLEEMRSANSAARSSNRLLDALMQEKNRSLKGIVGRLGDLGGIDKKFDVAISMSCGLLDSIVVDTTQTGRECIKFLQRNQLGKANFLALEKMNHLINQAQRRIQTPENVPRLIDLVQLSDPAYLGVFYYALRDTLVANDIDQATRVGLNGPERFRVVTLKGEIVDPSGTLTGGGGRTISGKMGTKAKLDTSIAQEEVDAMTTAVRNMEFKLTELVNRKEDMERQIVQKKRDYEHISQQNDKISHAIKDLTGKINSLEGRITTQQKIIQQKAIDPATLANHQKKVEKAKAAYDEVMKSTEQDRNNVGKLDEKIDLIKEEVIGGVKSTLEKLQKQYQAARDKKLECQVGISNSSRLIDQAQKKLENIETELVNVQERRKESKKIYDELVVEAQKINDEKEAVAAEREELSAQVAKSARNLLEFNKQESRLKSRQVEQQNIVNDLVKEFEQCTKYIDAIDRKIKGLRLEFIDEGDDENVPVELPEEQIVPPALDPETVKTLVYSRVDEEKAYLEEQKNRIQPNLNSIPEFKAKMGSYRNFSNIYLGKQQTLDQFKSYLQALKKARLQEFMTGFKIITQKVKEMYRTLTLGGDADLELVDSLDPFAEGIAYSVRPPRKTWKTITNLSGGEKTLSSLSLVFALHYYKPAPFYVMDEIDAALDHKNVSIIANYINERTKNTQFIIISLRDEMFSLARKLTGIYKPYNDTKTITVDINNFMQGQNKENSPTNRST